MSRPVAALLRVFVVSVGLGCLALQCAVRAQGDAGATCQPAWSALGSGMSGGFFSQVSALVSFDDGSGPALYAGGDFTSAGGVVVNCIAKWDGTTWSALGSGTNNPVNALAVFDDGSGPALYVGGFFTTAGGVPARGLARWDGTDWSAVGAGLGEFVFVNALAVVDVGGGPALHVGGQFQTAGSFHAQNIARWDGASWSSLGGGMNNEVYALAAFDDGSGPALCAGGFFTTAGGVDARRIAKWNGTSWSELGRGMDSAVWALAVFDAGSGPQLHAGGPFTTADDLPALRIASWNGTDWSPVGNGMNHWVQALAVFDDGSGPALYAGGRFTIAGGVAANRVARWDGAQWSALGNGIGDHSASVRCLTVFDAGSGAELAVGGEFTLAGFGQALSIAKWACGPPWTDLGSGLGGSLGLPQLTGEGTLVVGASASLALTNAWPSAQTILFLSLTSTPLPFKGGTLVSLPPLLALPLVSSPVGDIALTYPAWPPGASGMSLYFQYAIDDPSAPAGVALSNAVRADVP
jgi:trimeric autotransporter adhesin